MKNQNPLITVFTPTYNRAYILSNLYRSLLKQDSYNFEWLILNDGSTDETVSMIESWMKEDNPFDIVLHTVENGGKPRAINKGVELARGRYFLIVDSDDFLTPDAIGHVINWIGSIDRDPSFAGVGGAKGYSDYRYIKGKPPHTGENGYIDATNLERQEFDLDADMCEAYKTEVLKKYPFPVWEKEKFAPEQIVLNQIALDGYRLRWFPNIICICEYLEDGLTKGSRKLESGNPMGYAMMYNHMLKYGYPFWRKIYCAVQMIALTVYAGHLSYLLQSNDKLATFFALPAGFMLSIRRAVQFREKHVSSGKSGVG